MVRLILSCKMFDPMVIGEGQGQDATYLNPLKQTPELSGVQLRSEINKALRLLCIYDGDLVSFRD